MVNWQKIFGALLVPCAAITGFFVGWFFGWMDGYKMGSNDERLRWRITILGKTLCIQCSPKIKSWSDLK